MQRLNPRSRTAKPRFRGASVTKYVLTLVVLFCVVAYTLFADIVIAHVDVIAQKQTRARVYPHLLPSSASLLPTTLAPTEMNSTLPDNTALLQSLAEDQAKSSSFVDLPRSVAALQLALDAYINGLEFRVDSEDEQYKIRFSSRASSGGRSVLDVTDGAWDQCVADDKIIVSGTSFTREIYFAMLRWLKQDELNPEDKMIPSYNTELRYEGNCTVEKLKFKGTAADGRRWCISSGKRTKGCNLPGPAGLFIEKCGMPRSQTRHFERDNMTVSFRFKTYLYTPVVDATIFRALRTEENGLVVLGGGEWGRTPEKHFQYLSDPEEAPVDHLSQARHFVDQALKAMSHASTRKPPLLVIYCNKSFNRSCRAFCQAGLEAQEAFLRRKVSIPILVINISPFEKQYTRLRRRDRQRVPRLGHDTVVSVSQTSVTSTSRSTLWQMYHVLSTLLLPYVA